MDIVWVLPIELLLIPILAILWICREWIKVAWELIKNDWKDS